LASMSHYWKRSILLCSVTLLVPLSVSGQSLEVGGTVGVGARGSEGSLVRQEALPIGGVYGSVFWTDRFETMVRASWLHLGARRESDLYSTGCLDGGIPGSCLTDVAFQIVRRATAPRTFIAGSVLYHFRPNRPVWPFVGAGFGVMRDREHVSCEPAATSCDSLMGGDFRLGTSTSSRADIIGIAGLSTSFANHFVLRGSIHFHRPAGEELSLFETSFTFGYRF
jgi:hypothetical protein